MAITSEALRKQILDEAAEAREWLNSAGGKKFRVILRRAFRVDSIFSEDPYKMAFRAAQVDFVNYIETLATEGGFRNG